MQEPNKDVTSVAKDTKPPVPPKSMVHSLLQEMRENNKMRFVSKVSSSLVIVSVLALGFSTFYWANNPTHETIKMDQVEELPQTGEELTTNRYYSPDLKISFSLPETLEYDVEYQNDYISISDSRDRAVSGEIKRYENTNKDNFIQQIREKYSPIFINFEYVLKETLADGTEIYEINYTNPISFNQNSLNEVTKYILIKSFDQNLITVELTVTKNHPQSDNYLDTYKSLALSLSKAQDTLSESLTTINSDSSLSITYDTNVWIKNQFSNNEFLLKTNPNYLTDKEFSVSFKIEDGAEGYTESSKISDVLDQLTKNLMQNNPFMQIKINSAEYLIGKTPFLFSELYDNKSFTYTRIYLSYLPEQNKLIEIRSTYHIDSLPIINTLFAGIAANYTDILPETGTNEAQPLNSATFLTAQASVVKVFNRSCVTLEMVKLNKQEFDLCTSAVGSGFFVNEDGYVVTNAHVSSPNQFDLAVDSLFYGYDQDNLYDTLSAEAITYLSQNYPDNKRFQKLGDNDFKKLIDELIISYLVLNFEQNNIIIKNFTTENFVQNNTPFIINETTLQLDNSDLATSAEAITANEIESYYEVFFGASEKAKTGFVTSDIAVLKIKENNNPVLQIDTNSNPEIGKTVYALGFPGVINNFQLFSKSGNLVPTLTRGTISAIRPNVSEKYNLVQIDASVSHGNSGGPLIGENGQSIGIITYMVNSGQGSDFNVAISSSEIGTLLKNNNIASGTGEMNALLENGYTAYQKHYYKRALNYFNTASEKNIFAKRSLSTLVETSFFEIENGNDITPFFEIGNLKVYVLQAIFYILTLVILTVSLTSMIVVLFLAKNSLVKKIRKTQHLQKPHTIVLQTQMIGNPL